MPFLLLFHCNYISILYRFEGIVTYLPKFKDHVSFWDNLSRIGLRYYLLRDHDYAPFGGSSLSCLASTYLAHSTFRKFEARIFTRSDDTTEAPKFKKGQVMLTTPL